MKEVISLQKKVYGSISIGITNSLMIDHENMSLVDLVQSYYEAAQRRFSSDASDLINKAISELHYKKVDEEFELIEDDFKAPVFVEFDQKAINIWDRFVNLLSTESRKPTRNEIIQIRHEMEQYMIAVSNEEVKAAQLDEISGIYSIGRLYDEITGFIPP